MVGGRWRRDKRARLCTQHSAVLTVHIIVLSVHCSVVHGSVVCVRRACVACARCATLRVAALRVAHCAKHIPPWVKSQGGYVRACATCPCDARGCTVVLRALSVCTVVHMVLFRAWGRGASESLGRGQQDAAPPTLRVDPLPPRRNHIHQYTTSLSSTDLPGGRPAEDPGAPLLSAVCVSPSPQQPPGSGAAKFRKNSEATRQVENYLPQMSKTTFGKFLHLADTPQLGKAAKRPEERRHWRNPPRRGRTQARSPTPSDDPQKREENHDNKENRQRPQGTEGQPRATRRPPQAATRHATKTKANATDTRPGDIPPREDKESRTKKNAVATTSTKRYNNTTSLREQ